MSMPRILRTFLVPAAPLFSLVLLSGCGDDRYPRDLVFPARSDAIVVDTGKAEPSGFDRPGELSKLVHELEEKGGKVLDMDMGQEKEELKKLKAASQPDKEKITELEKRIGEWPKLRADLASQLNKMFGTPAQPTLAVLDAKEEGAEELPAIRDALRLDDKTLEKGSALYRRHCLHCHGVSGDGRGPTAPWVNPHPRDYRAGVFKFISATKAKPLRDDLLRTLRQGIEGTSMPSFGLLEEDELQALASTVIHLSLRGETEIGTIKAIRRLDERVGEADDGSYSIVKELQVRAAIYAKNWQKATAVTLEKYPFNDANPEEYTQSVVRGHRLIKELGCLSCHVDYGRKDKFIFDKWGTVVRPANLTAGVYRGGRRPADLYWRIHSGIDPAQMPSGTNALQGKQPWDLINFLKALPYPEMLPDDEPDKVRQEIYGSK